MSSQAHDELSNAILTEFCSLIASKINTLILEMCSKTKAGEVLEYDALVSLWNSNAAHSKMRILNGAASAPAVKKVKATPVNAVDKLADNLAEVKISDETQGSVEVSAPVNKKTCSYLFTKGKNAGTKCTTSVKGEAVMCSAHSKVSGGKSATKTAGAALAQKVADIIGDVKPVVPVQQAPLEKKTAPVIRFIPLAGYTDRSWHEATGFVVDKKTNLITWKYNNGVCNDLTNEDRDTCAFYNLKCVAPAEVVESVNDVEEEVLLVE